MGNIWNIKEVKSDIVQKYAKKFKISETLAYMLVAKGIEENNVQEYLEPDISRLQDPFLLQDMDKLVERVIKAKENAEHIVIYGDYDVDGVTSITVLHSFLSDIGVNSSYYLPDRLEEGYGLNKSALKSLKDNGTDLVITVDCGISAIEEAEYAKDIGLDLVITDHHECKDSLPDAIGVVNPKRPNSNYPCITLAGVGVTFKVITALAKKLRFARGELFKIYRYCCCRNYCGYSTIIRRK